METERLETARAESVSQIPFSGRGTRQINPLTQGYIRQLLSMYVGQIVRYDIRPFIVGLVASDKRLVLQTHTRCVQAASDRLKKQGYTFQVATRESKRDIYVKRLK